MNPLPLPLGFALQVRNVVYGDGDRLTEGVAFHRCEVDHEGHRDLCRARLAGSRPAAASELWGSA